MDFWEQIKTPGKSLKCSGLYLAQFRFTSPNLLASGDGTKSATIIGDVNIHPSAKVHPSAKIGPNVSISANARIGAGVRLISCIILDGVEIMENAVVFHAIVGWKSSIGKWSRVQASLTYGYFYMILMTKSYVILDFFYKCSTYVSNTYSDVGLRYDRKNKKLSISFLDSKLYSTLTPESRLKETIKQNSESQFLEKQ